MKLRPVPHEKDAQADLASLARAFAALSDPEAVTAFLRDLCTPAEIHELTGVSVTTTGRVARSLDHGHGGYAAAMAATPSSPESE